MGTKKANLYLLRHSEKDIFKIGRSTNLQGRISTLQYSFGEFNLKDSVTVKGDNSTINKLESIIHYLFDSYRIKADVDNKDGITEWFSMECFEDVETEIKRFKEKFNKGLFIEKGIILPEKIPGNTSRMPLKLRREIEFEQSKQDNMAKLNSFKKCLIEKKEAIIVAIKDLREEEEFLGYNGDYIIIFADDDKKIFEERGLVDNALFSSKGYGFIGISVHGCGFHTSIKGNSLSAIYYRIVNLEEYDHHDAGNIKMVLERFYRFLDDFLAPYLENELTEDAQMVLKQKNEFWNNF